MPISNLQRPDGVTLEEPESHNETFGRFSATPFERGYGDTVGNALRRILISSIEGAAITAVKFAGVHHELSTIEGVREDTLDIILNLKRIPIRVHGDQPRTIRLRSRLPGTLKSGQIVTDPHVDILDPEVYIATMTEPGSLDIEMRVRNARGYVPAEENSEEGTLEIGYLPVDSSHSPVRRANYTVQRARVGQRTDYDKLVLDVHTNGSITPEDAVMTSARLLRDMVSIFVGEHAQDSAEAAVISEEQRAYDRHALNSIDDYQDRLSVRAYNALRNAGIGTIGDLVSRTEDALLAERNVGRKSIEEVHNLLEQLGLQLGMGA